MRKVKTFKVLAILAGSVAAVIGLSGPAAAELVYLLSVPSWPAEVPANREMTVYFDIKINPSAPSSRTDTVANGQLCMRPSADWDWVTRPPLPTLANRNEQKRVTGKVKAKGTWTTAHAINFQAALGTCPDNQTTDNSNTVTRSLAVGVTMDPVYALTVDGWSSGLLPANRQKQLTFSVKMHTASSQTSTGGATGQICMRPTADWEWVGGAPTVPALANRNETKSVTGTIKAKGTWSIEQHALRFTAHKGQCPSDQRSGNSNEEARSLSVVDYSWTRPITTSNTREAVGTRLTSGTSTAEDTIAGNSIGAIVTNPGVKVRGDNKACTDCHGWAAGSSRQNFCDKVPNFVNSGSKPSILKSLFSTWRLVGCPD